ncbi:hypothetical protein V865_006576 [Kwoniella europaea PYCC6329]|uniref:LisH domain-containing protein n=1 Tax=Kwoniella europaea PYCC6329 TaxID=1423913 RepID=A0AAX4KQQ4_9TREE
MSQPSPEGRKRPRPSDADERDVKRLKNVDMDGDGSMKDGIGQEWIAEQMSRMEKLYKEVLIQAALVFQHQSFCKRLGLNYQKVPTHMMDRLETTWRTYEGIRRHVEWSMAQSGEKPPTSPNKPSSTLEAITRLASNAIPPKTMELPTPINLSIVGDYIPVLSTISPDKPEEVVVDQSQIQAPVLDKSGEDASAVKREESVPVQANQNGEDTITTKEIKNDQQQLPSENQVLPVSQTGLIQPPPPIESQPRPHPQVDGGLDYSSLGLDELTALINGNSFDTTTTSQPLPIPDSITNNDAQNQQNGNEIFASLGLDTGLPPSNSQHQQDGSQGQQQPLQPMEIDFTSALNGVTTTGGLDGEADFSALAGLFANEQPPTLPENQIGNGNNNVNADISGLVKEDSALNNSLEGLESLLEGNNEVNQSTSVVNADNNGNLEIQKEQSSENQVQNQNNVQISNEQPNTGNPTQVAVSDGGPADGQNESKLNETQMPPPVDNPPDQSQSSVQPTDETQVQPQSQSSNPEQPQPQPQPESQSQSQRQPEAQPQLESLSQPQLSFDQQLFQPDFSLPDTSTANADINQGFNVDGVGGGEFGEIDMSDFNFTDAGLEGMGMGGDEFERLMAEFG